ncbi:hypothetical protein Trichorick_01710 (plasmid) [Candidatus Trichorickettsia mobilis]|nr:hypothetical protein Trichorick_01710 [Candidatus Trichorickettsia mobilis]
MSLHQQVKVVGNNGQLSLGKEFAGQMVLIGVVCGKVQGTTLRVNDHHLQYPVRMICSHPRGERCANFSGGMIIPFSLIL